MRVARRIGRSANFSYKKLLVDWLSFLTGLNVAAAGWHGVNSRLIQLTPPAVNKHLILKEEPAAFSLKRVMN